MYLCVSGVVLCTFVWVPMVARGIDSLELELQELVSYLTWMLATKHGSALFTTEFSPAQLTFQTQ